MKLAQFKQEALVRGQFEVAGGRLQGAAIVRRFIGT
jgi:hypothetical protein